MIRAEATVSVMGMTRGRSYVLNLNSTVQGLLDRKFLVLIGEADERDTAFDLSPLPENGTPPVREAVRLSVRQGKRTAPLIQAPGIKPSPKRSDSQGD